MLLPIDDNLLVQDLQEHFSLCFPNLKLEFYSKPHHRQKASGYKDRIGPRTRIGTIRKAHSPGTLEIKSSDKTGEVKKAFKDLFGLNVQIFRNENNEWIQTTSTDTCSLKEQTEFSEHARVSIYPKSRKQINEYRLYL
jgi:hypothetical protein